MDDPLLTIVDSAMQRRLLNNILDLAGWEDEIEIFAPGYLELEAQVRVTTYDLVNLSTDVLKGHAQHTTRSEGEEKDNWVVFPVTLCVISQSCRMLTTVNDQSDKPSSKRLKNEYS
jgi:hypothetical protein